MKTKNIPKIFELNSKRIRPLETNAVSKLLPKAKNIKTVLFDIYGTLFISSSGDIGIHGKLDNVSLIKKVLKKSGVEFCKSSNIASKRASELYTELILASHKRSKKKGILYPEVKIENIWKSLLNILGKEMQIINPSFSTNQLKNIAALYESQINAVWPMPGLKRIILQLQKRRLKLGIISNAQFYTPFLFNSFLNKSISELGFLPEICFYSFKSGRAKPDLFMYKKAKETLLKHGIKNSEVLYVGNDMLKDILPASKVGFKTVLFAGDKRSLRTRKDNADCKKLKPDYVIINLRQLEEILF